MGEVVELPCVTTVDEPPEQTLERAKAWDLKSCLIMGFDEEGKFQLGASIHDAGAMILLLRLADRHIMATVESES